MAAAWRRCGVTSPSQGRHSVTDTRGPRRRAVLASAVGTTIEWYDFFCTARRPHWSSRKLFFPASPSSSGCSPRTPRCSSLSGPADRRRRFSPLRRPDRPQDNPDRHPAADGDQHVHHRAGAELLEHRCAGPDPADPDADRAGLGCGASGRLGLLPWSGGTATGAGCSPAGRSSGGMGLLLSTGSSA